MSGKRPIKCHFCGEKHHCKDCPSEKQLAPILKKKMGMMMEKYVAENLRCTSCGEKALEVMANYSPSLDIKCKCCNKFIEVKSKCLSVEKIPEDIMLSHGCYVDFKDRIEQGLNIILIIYGVNRIKKILKLREILLIPNSFLKNSNDVVNVSKRLDTNLSNINIHKKSELPDAIIPKTAKIFSFAEDTKGFIKS
jgi:hypothetical protein